MISVKFDSFPIYGEMEFNWFVEGFCKIKEFRIHQDKHSTSFIYKNTEKQYEVHVELIKPNTKKAGSYTYTITKR